jgi:hypothetical protein
VWSAVEEGYRLEQEPTCPDEVYKLMKRMWQADGTKRPGFATIHTLLLDICVKLETPSLARTMKYSARDASTLRSTQSSSTTGPGETPRPSQDQLAALTTDGSLEVQAATPGTSSTLKARSLPRDQRDGVNTLTRKARKRSSSLAPDPRLSELFSLREDVEEFSFVEHELSPSSSRNLRLSMSLPDLDDPFTSREASKMGTMKSVSGFQSDTLKRQDKHAKAALAAYRRQEGRLHARRRAQSAAEPVDTDFLHDDRKTSTEYTDLVSEDGRVLSAKESFDAPNHVKRDFTLSRASTAASSSPPEQRHSEPRSSVRPHAQSLTIVPQPVSGSVLSLESDGSDFESEIEI